MSLILSALLAAAVILAVWQFTAARRATRQAADLTMRLSEANDSVNRDAQQISRLEAELEAAHDSLESVRENALSARNSLNDAHERFIAELRKNSDMQIDSLSEQLNEARQTAERLSSLLATTGEENARLKTSLKHFTDQASEREEMLKSQFRNLAGDILRENSMQFKTQNAERLSEILGPLMTNIDEFKKAVRENHEADTKERSTLAASISQLRNLNDSVMQETRNLTNALRGNNQMQGNWGEMVLENILKASGLTEGREYKLQATTDLEGHTLRDEQGRGLRPDVIVDYPDGSRLVIDAKTNLSNYFTSIDTSLSEEERTNAARSHAMAVRAQVDSLAKRDYSAYVGESRIDMVMMFIPNEPAYMTAMHADGTLWDYAYQRKVLIVSPTHLIAALRLIKNLWVRDRVTANALKIAKIAGEMYDKFAAFTADLDKIGKALDNSQGALKDAFTKLTGKGSLVSKAQSLKTLGVKTSKNLSPTIREAAGLDLPEAETESD